MTDYFLQLFEANRPTQEEKDRQQVTVPDSVGTLWLGPRIPQRVAKSTPDLDELRNSRD